jgi:hypothetical protein
MRTALRRLPVDQMHDTVLLGECCVAGQSAATREPSETTDTFDWVW